MKSPDPVVREYWFSGGDVLMRVLDGAERLTPAAATALHSALAVHCLDAAKRGAGDALDYLKRREEELRFAIQARHEWRRAAGWWGQ